MDQSLFVALFAVLLIVLAVIGVMMSYREARRAEKRAADAAARRARPRPMPPVKPTTRSRISPLGAGSQSDPAPAGSPVPARMNTAPETGAALVVSTAGSQMAARVDRLEQIVADLRAENEHRARVIEIQAEELDIREAPDPILRMLRKGPATGSMIETHFGITPEERDARCERLLNVTCIGLPGADPVYTWHLHGPSNVAEILQECGIV